MFIEFSFILLIQFSSSSSVLFVKFRFIRQIHLYSSNSFIFIKFRFIHKILFFFFFIKFILLLRQILFSSSNSVLFIEFIFIHGLQNPALIETIQFDIWHFYNVLLNPERCLVKVKKNRPLEYTLKKNIRGFSYPLKIVEKYFSWGNRNNWSTLVKKVQIIYRLC